MGRGWNFDQWSAVHKFMMRMQRDRNVKSCSAVVVLERMEDCMSLSAHLNELKKKHENLSNAVEKELRAPGADTLKVAELKKQKLRLKEEINRLSV
ncbi:hypothetical protein SAMN05444149_103429 [Pseudosulfitobacter pseudonitzschiae]|nr:hypothetical protein SAMN05444149_103429 [Pseudosulfitobacter pseudonitzschiae]